MRSYGQYCPISRAANLLGDRWSLLILRDLVLGTTRFNELVRGNPGLSRSLLSQRLDQLQRQGLVERTGEGRYRPTPAGDDLRDVLMTLAEWGARWAFGDPLPEELDPDLLVWWLHRNLDPTVVAGRRFVVHVTLTDHRLRYWIVVDPEPSVCKADPGFDVDVTVRSDRATLYRVHLGRQRLTDAIAAGAVVVEGSTAARRSLVEMLRFSPVAPIVQAATEATVSLVPAAAAPVPDPV